MFTVSWIEALRTMMHKKDQRKHGKTRFVAITKDDPIPSDLKIVSPY